MLTEVEAAPPHESVTDGESDEGSVAIAAILAALGVLCVASAVSIATERVSTAVTYYSGQYCTYNKFLSLT